MQFPFKPRHALVACLLLSPFGAFAADIQINGVCIQGTCPPPSGTSDALQFGQSVPMTSGSTVYTFGDGDQYSVMWSYSAAFNASGTTIFVDPTVSYIGSSASVGNDLLTFSFYQNYYDNSPGNWDGSYTESIPLMTAGNVGAGTSADGELFYDGQGLGIVGPYSLGNHFGTNTMTLTGLNDPTLSAQYLFQYSFKAGTQTGAGFMSPPASAVPEPSETLPLAALGLGACVFAVRRRPKLGKI